MHFSVKTFVTLLVGSMTIATGHSAYGQVMSGQAQTTAKSSRVKATREAVREVAPKAPELIPPHSRDDIFCAINEFRDGFPTSVRFRIFSVDDIEVRSTDQKGVESARAMLKRLELASQPKVAVFSIGGSAGVSGEAKLLLTKDALKFGEISTMMIVNQTMRETGIFQCRKLPGSF